MALVKDKETKELILKVLNERQKKIKTAYNSGSLTSEEYKREKKRIMDKKKTVRAGKYDL